MKKLILLLTFFTICNSFAQKVNWVNAPLNPVAFKYKLEDFNLKGNIVAYNEKVFKDGKLFYDNKEKTYYKYNDNGQIIEDSEENTYNYNNKGQLLTIIQSSFNKTFEKKFTFEYDENSRLKSKEIFGVKTNYTYNSNGQLVSEENTTNGVISSSIVYNYATENKLLKIIKIQTEKKGNIVTTETYYYNKGILVKKIDKVKGEITYQTKIDMEGNILKEDDITFSQNEITKNFSLSAIDEKQLSYFVVSYFTKIYVNNKYAAFMPVETVNNISVVFDIFNKDYYRVNSNYNKGIRETTLSLLAKNKEALFIKPKDYNRLHPRNKYYNLIYAGVNRNENRAFGPHIKLNTYDISDTAFLIYDRFFDVNYYATVNFDEPKPIYILSEALPTMFYFDARANGNRTYYFIHNGLEIEASRMQLKFTNKEQDIDVFVDGKLTYAVKNYKALENRKVYYPTVL